MDEDAFLTGGGKAAPRAKVADGGGGIRQILFLFLLPWLMFSTIAILFTFANYHASGVVDMVVFICAALSLVFGVLGSKNYSFLSLLCLVAVASGTFVGYVNYSWNMEPYWFYEGAREYHNVLASEPAAAHGDAGKIFFAEAAAIDSTKAVGWKLGDVYCVAPIMDPYSGTRVEYWAVGINCCTQRGEFSCDDAKVEGAGAAKGGLVVQDRGVFAASPFDHYHHAVKTAEAAYDLVSSSEPLFVRWVKDPEALQTEMFTIGTWGVVLASLLYGAINGGLAMAVQSVTKRQLRP